MDPFYWEDIDLSFRAQKRGYKIIFDKNIIVDHYHDEGSIKKHYNNKKIMTIAYRNQFIFHWKNLTDISLILSHIFWLPIHFGQALISLDQAFLIGFGKACLKIPRILSNRSKNKHILSDKQIINQDW
jgi:GT2 family glycosyltransferase